ncbi:hypothetical protein FB451DRAFT_1363747 [Mycena latifolia]|nr:hypothetical protein FB451DRAFT_1363747 [Mycena latifolia]
MDRRFPVLLRGRDRVRHFVKKNLRLTATSSKGANCHDLLWTALTALRTSSDAFPPLKGVVGAVTSVMEVSQRVCHSKKDARELSQRAVRVLELLADALPDPTTIPEPMLASIGRFEMSLKEIREEMSRLANHGRIWRLLHLNRSEGALRKFDRRLDEASREFAIGSAVRGEASTYAIQAQVSDVAAVALVLHEKQTLLLRGVMLLQMVFFWPSPVLAVQGASVGQ